MRGGRRVWTSDNSLKAITSLPTQCIDLRQRLTTVRTQQALLAQVLVANAS